MHRRTVSDAGDAPSPRSSRAPSFSSDRPTVAGSAPYQMPTSARPPPAYIAASVASQIVTDHHNAQLRDEHDAGRYGEVPLLTNAVFSDQALSLLNGFLDNLLFAFLAAARSPALAAVRPAITEVLKPRLAREATATADDELQGLLGGEDDEFPEPQSPSNRAWDVEKVWKRTRLRIMVYTRLGELEDEDEERYVLQERGLSMDDAADDELGLVSWASAIFLTSVIEYVAEQTLLLSGQASYNRMAAKLRKAAQKNAEGDLEPLERIIVEEHDVEKIALNSALGRLWRTWRKRVRAPITPLGVRSRASYASMHSRQQSLDLTEKLEAEEGVPEVQEREPTETEIAANIPLPIGDNDVNEIEVPGLVRASDEEEDEDTSGANTPTAPKAKRPTSVIMLSPADVWRKKRAKAPRPLSMPLPASCPFWIPPRTETKDSTEDDEPEVFATPMERPAEDDESFIMDEEQESIHGSHEKHLTATNADMVAFAASTGLGLTMPPTTPIARGFDREVTDAEVAPSPDQVLPAKRMSIEKPGPPGIVRTKSVRSQGSLPPQTPPEPRSFLDDAHPDDDVSNPLQDKEATPALSVQASAVSSRSAARTEPADEVSTEPVQRKQPDQQGFVELEPRRIVTEATKEPQYVPYNPPPRQEAPREKGPLRREITPPKGRGPVLESLKEVDDAPNSPPKNASPRQVPEHARRYSSSNASTRNRSRESPLPVVERAGGLRRPSADSSPLSRTVGSDGAYVEKASLKRVSSNSTSRSASTSILNVGRESDGSLSRPRGLTGRMSQEDREREFDSLVKSEDTVKFTLTPQSMRDMDEPTLVRTVEAPRPATSSSGTVVPRVSSDRGNTGSRNGSRNGQRSPTVSSYGPKPLAREPRIHGESIRDMADFIRSTGPSPGAQRPVQPFVSLAGAGAQSPPTASPASGIGRAFSTRKASSNSAHSHSKTSSLAGEGGPSARPRIHMEPRSPAGQRSGNDDLIDFIRQGPPGPNGNRIPRAVAPFRSTVDSDQFDRMLDDNSNVDSTYSSQISSVSRQSANSRTGLLPPASTVQPAYSNTPQMLNPGYGSMGGAEGTRGTGGTGAVGGTEPQVQRTRRRVKDPYAIDWSDEEDEEDEEEDMLTALPNTAPKRQERQESLADFLLSSEPPRNSNPQPFVLSEATIAKAKARAATQTSGSSGSLPSSGSGSGSGGTTATNKPRLQAKNAGVREPIIRGKSSTSDLADFLRTSGPPEPVVARRAEEPEQPVKKSMRFWRKKSEVA